jgi:protoheme IX farnesyltransferase
MPPDSRHDARYPTSAAPAIDESGERGSWLLGLWELTKPRLSFLSIVTALVGYLSAQPERDFWLLVNFLVGTAVSAGGAAVLNQWMEWRTDSLMGRTMDRPIPSGVIKPVQALSFGLLLSIIGPLQLFLGVNGLASTLAAATILTYLLFYTPSKARTQWSTEVGAISGALPPLIGWAAARGTVDGLGWVLFAVLFFWQIPHFLAIAWTYRADYAKAKFPMLPVVDAEGGKTARWALLNTVVLVAVSLLPPVLGFSSWLYGAVAAVLGAIFLYWSISLLSNERRDFVARKTFFYSIIYLPALLAALVLDRWLA